MAAPGVLVAPGPAQAQGTTTSTTAAAPPTTATAPPTTATVPPATAAPPAPPTTASDPASEGQCRLAFPSIIGCQGQGGNDPLAGAAGRLFGPAMRAGAGIALDAMAQWFGHSAAWFLDQLGTLLESAQPHLEAVWFTGGGCEGRRGPNRPGCYGGYGAMAGLAGMAVLPVLLLAVIRAIVRQDLGGLVRAALVHLPAAVLLTFVAVNVVDASLSFTDMISRHVALGAYANAHETLKAMGVTATEVALATGTGIAPLVAIVITAIVILGALLLWIELVLRAAAIYVAVLFLPLALAALIWPATAHWSRRLAETIAALVLAKFVVVAVLALGAGALQSGVLGTSGHGAADLVPGACILLLAAFAPYGLLRLIPLVEVGSVAHMEGTSRRVVGTTGRAATSAVRMAAFAAGGGGAAGEGGEAGGQGASAASTQPNVGAAVGVPPAVVGASAGPGDGSPLSPEEDGDDSAQQAATPQAAADEDLHFAGRPSFQAALAELGGLEGAYEAASPLDDEPA